MPRNYKRKTNRGQWLEKDMTEALNAVKAGLPYRTASKTFKVPIMSLKRRAKNKNKVAVGAVKYLGGRRLVFTSAQEQELVNYITEMETLMYGLTRKDVLSLAFQLAVRNNIPNPFKNEAAGIEWLKGFRKRHKNITLRMPESTSTARARAFNKPVVDKFYNILKKVLEEKKFPPTRIFNVDETSVSTVPTKNTKVFAATGRKQVARVTSAERGETTTVVVCMSASGYFIPPMFIFRRIRMKIELMDGAPPGSIWACNNSGWMKLEVFTTWFDHFLRHTKPTEDDPVLLILDGHLSHTKNIDVILKARENHVTIVCLPPHCTHKLQPLDVSLMYPLSIYHNQALERWMNNNPGRPVTVFQIAKIFGEAYLKAAVPTNAINGFAKTGLCPLNPEVFTEADFVAASITDVALDDLEDNPREISEAATDPIMDSQPSGPAASAVIDTQPFIEENLLVIAATDSIMETQPSGLDARALLETQPFIEDNSMVIDMRTPSPVNPIRNRDEFIGLDSPLSPLPSTSNFCNRNDGQVENFYVSPVQIQPLPKLSGKRSSKLPRKKQDTTILTGTPYKTYLEEEIKKKSEKENKAEKRKTKRNVPQKKVKTGKSKKGKGKGKGISNRNNITESETDDEDETYCFLCTTAFSKDKCGEGWIKCITCDRWSHEKCAGADSDDEYFSCDICQRKEGIRRLDL